MVDGQWTTVSRAGASQGPTISLQNPAISQGVPMSNPTPRHWRRSTPVPALLTLLVAAPLVGGCSQRMAAKINGDVISQQDFYKRTANWTQGQLIGPPVGVVILNDIINEQLMRQEAKRLKLEVSDAEVNTQIENFRKRAKESNPPQSLDDTLKQNGLALDTFKEALRFQLLQQKLMTQGVTVTDKEIEEFYNQNKQSQFTTPEQAEAAQITVASQAAANEVMQTLSKNASFALVARSKSIDTFKEQGGKLPTLTRGFPNPSVSPEVISAVFSAPVGKAHGPIKVGNNWVIIRVEKRTPQSTRTLAEVKEDLRQMLLMQKAQNGGQVNKFRQRLMELRRDADIQIGMDQFKGPIEEQQKTLKQAPTPGVPQLPPGQ
jgi:foldase protein PrsA